tara:strand:- start:2861 stop:3355 length:495 start_codon:yes stop_codon:yes gene_type:complete
MGYTHYWYMKKDKKVSEQKWTALTKDVKKLLDDSPILERAKQQYGADDEYWNDLTITDNEIRFDGGHETFILERKPVQSAWRQDQDMVFNFCKTARKEYDGLVTATLILAKHHLGDEIKISSDGDLTEWKQGADYGESESGFDIVQKVLILDDAENALSKIELD